MSDSEPNFVYQNFESDEEESRDKADVMARITDHSLRTVAPPSLPTNNENDTAPVFGKRKAALTREQRERLKLMVEDSQGLVPLAGTARGGGRSSVMHMRAEPQLKKSPATMEPNVSERVPLQKTASRLKSALGKRNFD